MTQQVTSSGQVAHDGEVKLSRSLKLPDLIIYGMCFMGPVAPIAYYGTQVKGAHGMVGLAYLIGMLAILFSCFSYCSMAKRYPLAGSVYTFVQQGSGSPSLGFISGWGIVCDYLFAVPVTFVISNTFLSNLWPNVPKLVWVLAFTVIIVTSACLGINFLANLNKVLLALELILIGWFAVGTFVALAKGTIQISFVSFYNPAEFNLNNVMSATGLVILAFLGFDGVSTLAEEVDDPKRNVPRGMVGSVLLTGAIFLFVSFLFGCIQPDPSALDPDTAAADALEAVGGVPLKVFTSLLCGLFAFALTSGLENLNSVSRIFYAMGRDGMLPKAFGRLDPKRHTPIFSVLVVGAIAIAVAMATDLDVLGSVISFGALVSFVFLNGTVIKHLFIDSPDKSFKSVITHVVSPTIAMIICIYILVNLGTAAWIVGCSWIVLGIIILAIKTKGFTTKVDTARLTEYFA